MNKSLIAIISIIGIIIIGVLLFMLKQPADQYQQVIKTIPKDAVIILKINSVSDLLSALQENNNFQNLPKNSLRTNIENLKTFLDSLCEENSEIRNVLNDSSVYISLHNIETRLTDVLIYVPFGKRIKQNIISNKLYLSLVKRGYELIQYSPATYKVNTYKIKNRRSIYYFFKKNLLIIGSNIKNLTDAYRQFDNKNSLVSDTCFSKIYATTGKKAIGNIYINFQQFSSFFADVFHPSYREEIQKALKSKGWFALDIGIDQKFISFHGFSALTSQKQIWLKAIKNEVPVENTVCDILPASVVFYSSFSFSDPYNYRLALKEAWRYDKKLTEKLDNLKQHFGNDIVEKIFNILDETITMSISYKKDGKYSMYCIIKTKSYTDALDFIKPFRNNKNRKPQHYKTKAGENNDSIKENSITRLLPGNNLPVVLFGKVFDFTKYSYVCNFKQYLIFGESEESLNNYLSELYENKTLINDTIYRNIVSSTLSSKSNLTIFFNVSLVRNLINKFFEPQIKEKLEKNLFNAETNTYAGIQISGNGQYNYNNIFFYNDFTPNIGPELAWSIKLDTSVEMSAALTTNSTVYKNLFFIQDKKLNIYLISSLGKVLWKQFLGEKIISSTYIIDYYKNNRLQLLFNTAENLYIIDNNGKSIKGFPLKFKHPAVNGLAIADFDNNQNYRYYIAFKNKTFVALTKDGRKVEGWKFEKTEGIVTDPAQCFTYHKKDYILFSDSGNVYLLNRKGERRFKLKQPFHKSLKNVFFIDEKPNFFRLVATDTTGQVNFIYPDGHIEKIRLTVFSKNHNFSFSDIDDDGRKDYLFSDSNTLSVFNQEKKIIFSILFNAPINQKPLILKSKKDIISIFTGSTISNKVYKFDKDGKIAKGFPINGNFPLNVLSLSDNNYTFTLLSGNEKILNYYYIK